MSEEKPALETVTNIYQRMNAVMRDAEYIQKGAAQQGKGVLYDDVAAMLKPLFVEHGIALEINQSSLELVSSVSTNQKVYQGAYEVAFINIDNPSEKSIHSVIAQGMDGGDKAPGKASTYALKLILTKVFLLESGVNEESRAEIAAKNETISQEQYTEILPYLVDKDENWNAVSRKLSAAYGINQVSDLPAVKYQEALDRARKAST